MRMLPSSRVLALSSLGLISVSCALFKGAVSQPPTMVPRSWQVETVLVEAGNAQFGTPSVFLDGEGAATIAVADRAFYMGTQSIALGRRSADGWTVEFPLTPSADRVCGRAGEGSTVVVTHGGLDGPLSAIAWDGVTSTLAEAGPCPSAASMVRSLGESDDAPQVELSGDRRTLWHRVSQGEPCGPHDAEPRHKFGAFGAAIDEQGLPQLLVFERAEDGAPGRLRHAVCRNLQWTSSVVAEGIEVVSVDLVVDDGGQPHLGYVSTPPRACS